MAKIINIETGAGAEVKEDDNTSLKRSAEKIGVLFGCEDGRCGSCRVEIAEGMDNLNKRTQKEIDQEKDLSLHDPYRLICQCKIKNKNGIVKIRSQ